MAGLTFHKRPSIVLQKIEAEKPKWEVPNGDNLYYLAFESAVTAILNDSYQWSMRSVPWHDREDEGGVTFLSWIENGTIYTMMWESIYG